MARSATSLFIGDSSIWVLEARGKNPHRWGTVALEPGLVRDGVVLNQEAVAAKVRELYSSSHVGGKQVIAGISGINCLYRLISLPELPGNLLPEAVRREAARTLGVQVDQVYISWQVVASAQGETRVYLAAAPRNSVDSLIATLRRAGLNPYLMDLRPLAIARTTAEGRAVVVDVQPANLDVVVRVSGQPAVIRSVSVPREDSLEDKMTIIRDEMNRAITFYNSSHPDDMLDASVPILVSGELAEQERLWSVLTPDVERPVRALPSPVQTPEGFPAHQYMANIGLAFKEVLSGRELESYCPINLNALPEVYRPKPRPISDILFVPAVIAGIAAVVLGGYVTQGELQRTRELRAQWQELNQMVVSLTTEMQQEREAHEEEITTLEKNVDAAEQKARAFSTTVDAIVSNREQMNGDLAIVNDGLKMASVHLGSLSHTGDNLVVDAVADTVEAAFAYASFLRGSGRFDPVVITDMSRTHGQVSFSLTLTRLPGS